MYIPELDALIFLATEFLGGGDDQPHLQVGIQALYEAAGTLCIAQLGWSCLISPGNLHPYRSQMQPWRHTKAQQIPLFWPFLENGRKGRPSKQVGVSRGGHPRTRKHPKYRRYKLLCYMVTDQPAQIPILRQPLFK